jgi:hypothetical protein
MSGLGEGKGKRSLFKVQILPDIVFVARVRSHRRVGTAVVGRWVGGVVSI